jgi:hypothetical protein
MTLLKERDGNPGTSHELDAEFEHEDVPPPRQWPLQAQTRSSLREPSNPGSAGNGGTPRTSTSLVSGNGSRRTA